MMELKKALKISVSLLLKEWAKQKIPNCILKV